LPVAVRIRLIAAGAQKVSESEQPLRSDRCRRAIDGLEVVERFGWTIEVIAEPVKLRRAGPWLKPRAGAS